MKVYDYLIVGSGCSAAMAAQTLVEANVNVVMFDVGIKNNFNTSLIPNDSFLNIRKKDNEQYKYFIGPSGEGLNWGKVGKGAQITPPRLYMTNEAEKFLPLKSSTFSPVESLSYGGLGIGWGLQCWEYSRIELERTGLNSVEIQNAYKLISQRIGISAARDEAADYTIGGLDNYQPAAKADRNHLYIQKKYQKHKDYFKRNGIYVGRTPLALITERKGARKGYKYRDMDYYSNDSNSAWRPPITVDKLRKKSNFEYFDGRLITNFKERGDLVEVRGINTKSGREFSVICRKLILASGALSTARIVLRSVGKSSDQLPILSNPHSYIPCIQPTMLGQGTEKNKLGFGQLSYFIDKEGNDDGISVASSYSYQSLMLFRLINQFPVNFSYARKITKYITPALIIMIAQHPDSPTSNKFLRLIKATDSLTGDKLEASFKLSSNENDMWNMREKEYVSMMRKFNTYALKRVSTDPGASIHYAGTLPFSNSYNKLSITPKGRLHGSKNIYIADSSGFKYLPAKGLTFTLMANAHLTAENVLNNL